MNVLRCLVVFLLFINGSLSWTDALRGTIRPGAGYSSFEQKVTENVCFKPKPYYSSSNNELQIEKTESYSELEKRLKINGKISGSYETFVGKLKAEFEMNSTEKGYSLSQIVYVHRSEKVTLDFENSGPESCLSRLGKSLYTDANGHFKLACGDHYISSFSQGAVLVLGLKIKFLNLQDKEKVTASATLGLNIADITANVKQRCDSTKTSALVSIHAKQFGGKPNELEKIKWSKAFSCNMAAVNQCLETAKMLVEYLNEFGKQFGEDGHQNMAPMGDVAFEKIELLGLHTNDKEASQELLEYRDWYQERRQENQYYEKNLEKLLDHYKIELDGTFKRKAKKLLKVVQNNSQHLPEDDIIDCYINPTECPKIKKHIYEKIQNITKDHLKFLENIKYFLILYVQIYDFKFYNNGGENVENSWDIAESRVTPKYLVQSMEVTESLCQIELRNSEYPESLYYNGTWDPMKSEYIGKFWDSNSREIGADYDVRVIRKQSEFYFTDYYSENNLVL